MKRLIGIIILIIVVIVAVRLVNFANKPKISDVKIEAPVMEDEPKVEFEPLLEEEASKEPSKEPLKKSDFQLGGISFEDEPSSNLGEIF